MKKLFALLAVVLAVVSCQRDADDLNVAMGGEQEVMLTVSLPEATRADSAEGFDLSKLGTTYDLRYILEIYRVDANGVVLYDKCQRFVETSDSKTMVFPVRLAPGYNYRIVAWADIVDEGSKADRYYYTEEGLDNVVIKDNGTVNWNAMDETRDAYTYVKIVDDFDSASNLDMTLTRPFAKVRVVATDIEDIRNVGLEPTIATVEYAQDMYVKYNAVEDICIADGAKKKKHEYTYTTTASKYEDDDNDGELTLFTDYIFVPALRTAKFTLNVYADANKSMLIKGNNFNTDIFVERNKLTTIKGDVLTTGGNIKVTVDNDLGVKETYTYVDTAEDLQDKINNAATNGEETNISLGGDIDLGDLFSAGTLSTRASATLPIVIAEGKVVALDLNGHKITTPFVEGSTTNHAYAFENHGTLTIKDSSKNGNGKIVARGNFNYGTMTLESGTIDACDGNGGYGVRNYEGATFVMNGGAIVTSIEDDNMVDKGGYDATTLRIDEGATAEIKAGIINNICDYTFAIDNYGATTVNGGTMTSIHSTVSSYGNMTINGGSFTCNGLEGVSAHALVTWDGSVTNIYGGTFDGKDNYNGFNVDACAGALVNIYGGKFLSVHSGSLYGEGTITVKGGEFFDKIADKYVASGYKVKEENGVFTVGKPAALVEFEEAIAQGGEVTLDADITLAETAVVESGKTVVLNLNGKTITGNWHKDNGHIIKNNGTLTIVGGTISSTGDNGGSAVMNNGTLTVNDATLNGAPNANGKWPSYAVNNIGTMTVKNTTITSYHGAVASYGDGALVTLNNCTIDMAGIPGFTSHGIYTYNNGKVVVNGGTYENKATDQNSSGASVINGAVEVNAGTFSGRIENYSGTPVLKGGTFSVKPNAKFIAEGYQVVEKNGAYKVVSNLVAKIGNEEYTSLQAAIEAVEDGETIVIQRDIDIATPAYGQNALNHAKAVNFTLDLNGKTISGDTGNSIFRYNIANTNATSNVTITLKNGTVTSGDNTWCTVMATGLSADVKAIFNLKDLTINASKAGDFAVKAWQYAVINAENVTVNATKCAGGFYAVGGEIVLDNCTVNQKGLHTSPYMSMAIAVSTKGKLTVNSGNYSTEPTATAEGYNQGTSHGSWCAGVMNSGGELIINGGTYANGNFGDDALATAARGLIFGDTASKIVINDGTFNALKTVIDYQNNLGVQPNPNIVINGGNFSANPAIVTSYGGVVLAEGKVAAQGADGRWTLVDGVVDEAGLKAAFEQGGNIVLGADITVAEPVVLPEGKTATLDLNGKTLAADDEANKYAINNHGTLTIKGNGTVNARGMYNGYDANGNYVTTAKLTIENGTFNAKGTNGGACVFNYGNVDINGGTFTSIGGYSLNNQASGSMNIYSATVTGGIYNIGVSLVVNDGNIQTVRAGYTHAIYHNGTSLVINGGTFMGNGNEVVNANSAVATINGGTFTKDPNGQTSYLMAGANMTINNGTFNAHASNPAGHPVRPDVIVKGGTFNYKHSNIAAGYKIVDNGNGTWTVVAE